MTTTNNLRTAIAQHDQLSGISREFKVGDLVVKTHPKNTILWSVLGVYKNGGVWLDYKGFCWKPPRVRHATLAEIKAGRRLDHSEDVTDTVTDIHNHISPNMKVINHG